MAHRVQRQLLATSLAACAAALPLPALGADSGGGAVFDSSSVNYEPPPTSRRGGFAVGFSSGFGLGAYRGYPLEVDALNDPNGQQRTGAALSNYVNAWVGGSPRDFLTIGLGVAAATGTGDTRGLMSGVLFHVEAFPFFSYGEVFRELGLSLDGGLGIGFMTESDKPDYEDRIADGGAMSTLALGVFWEPIEFWHVSGGPALTYMRSFSQTMNIDQVTVGMRWALYGTQPKQTPATDVAHAAW